MNNNMRELVKAIFVARKNPTQVYTRTINDQKLTIQTFADVVEVSANGAILTEEDMVALCACPICHQQDKHIEGCQNHPNYFNDCRMDAAYHRAMERA